MTAGPGDGSSVAPLVINPADAAPGGAKETAYEALLVRVDDVEVLDVTPPAQSGETITDEFLVLLSQYASVYDVPSFKEFVLYLDVEAKFPKSKERPGYWLGVAHNIGDALTFWVLDAEKGSVLA